MTKERAEAYFRAFILPEVKRVDEPDGLRDNGARRFAWAVYTDGLCKSGEITDRQFSNWSTPRICG